MPLTRRRLAAFGVAAVLLLCALAVVGWMLTRPKPLPHPLAIAPADIAAVSVDGVAVRPAAAGAVLARLAASRPIPSPAWLEPRVVRIALRSGVILWMQVMPEGQDVVLRVNADLPANPTLAQSDQARRIRALRLGAYRLPADSVAAMLDPTDLSTGEAKDRRISGVSGGPQKTSESREKSSSNTEIP